MHEPVLKNKINIKLFLELFLSLLESGVTIPLALKTLCEDDKTSFYAKKILSIMEKNISFAKAVSCLSKKMFQYEQILLVAEETGDIVPILKNIITELKENDESKKEIFVVSIYPIFISIFAFILSFILYFYGIPYISKIAQISEPTLIQGIIKASIWIFFTTVILITLIFYMLYKNSFAYKFFRNVYYMALNSVGLEKSLTMLLKTEGFKDRERKVIIMILEDIRNGEFLYRSCKKIKHFDVFTTAWLTIAQDNGKVKESFEKIYNHYFLLKKQNKELLMRIIEPGVLLIAGGYILILIVECVVPIFLTLGNTIL